MEKEDSNTNAVEESIKEVSNSDAMEREIDNTFNTDTVQKVEIKSTAIVKYSVPKPAQFMKLKCNTDLNLPPSNWLSSSADSYGLQHVLCNQTGFSSFRMAHMFPDCVGEVDVVSDTENIKNLLKIPYSKNHVSMMVHRVENALLLDDFDIYKHLLRTSQNDWKWLKTFFFENINQETCNENQTLFMKNRRREALKEKSLISKFLYHSLVLGDGGQTEFNIEKALPLPVQSRSLPKPVPTTSGTNPSHRNYNQNVVWTFEDIEMLTGTDLPIFGGGTRPCISLRLRDVSKPINVLTGIDYWLDNLMSNVPEVVMCYHLNGTVQQYELIKTEDLPQLDNSKFSPQLIKDVAQNILSFLKSNATKAGHTYWLFKGKNEEVVKLYDLTSLCSEKDVENNQNPFTIPVAMLLYHVARNMKHSSSENQPGTIRMLLKNCIQLLPEENYPEIVTSSHYMLSDLYIPADTNPEAPIFDQFDESTYDPIYDDDEDGDDDGMTKTLVLDEGQSRNDFTDRRKTAPPITGSTEERCLQSLQHIAKGLDCQQFFPKNKQTDCKTKDEIKTSEPFGYSKLSEVQGKSVGGKKTKNKRGKKKSEAESNALLLKNKHEAQTLPTWEEGNNGSGDISWEDHLKTLLYEKAVLVYAALSENHFISGCFGSSLRTIELLARCQLVMSRLIYTSNALQENCLLGRAGDCGIMMVRNWNEIDSIRERFQSNSEEDANMMVQLEKDERLYDIDVGNSKMKLVFQYDLETIEQMLIKAVECYSEALKSCKTETILLRLGNHLNELACFYLNEATSANDHAVIVAMCTKSEPYLQRGLAIFEKVKDASNTALLYSNMGHLHRLLAHTNPLADRGDFTQYEINHFNKAVLNYKSALQVIGDRAQNQVVWDDVHWELSSTLFNMGTAMEDNPPTHLAKDKAEKLVIETLQKALQYCDLDETNPKFPFYLIRAATLHYSIGCLYHSHIWTEPNDNANRRNMIQLIKINYEKSTQLYFEAQDGAKYFTSQLQRLALSEYLVETSTASRIKLKHLEECFKIALGMDRMLKLIVEKKVELVANIEVKELEDEPFKTPKSLLNLFKQRLQHILKMLIKIYSINPISNKDCTKLCGMYKSCYVLTFQLKDGSTCDELVYKLHEVLQQIQDKVAELSTI